MIAKGVIHKVIFKTLEIERLYIFRPVMVKKKKASKEKQAEKI